MKTGQLAQTWQQGNKAINGWLSIANPFVTEIMASQLYDSLTIDMQHGVIDYADMVQMIPAIIHAGKTPIVRVPWLDPAAIMKALDAGAIGIICPMINTREQAEALVRCMRYPPRGLRSFGPTRANFLLGQDYYSHANDSVFCLAMIETEEAMGNLADIASTPGIDGLYIGPADLTIGTTHGRLAPGFDRREPEMHERILAILAAAKSNDIKACLHCGSSAYAVEAMGWGFDLCTVGNDARQLAASVGQMVGETRELMGEASLESGDNDTGY